MDIEKLIEKLRTESLYEYKATLEIMDLCMEAADAIEKLEIELKAMRCAANSLKADLKQAEKKNDEYLRRGAAQEEEQRKELGLKHRTDRIVLDSSVLSRAWLAERRMMMTDIERIIRESEEHVEYFSHPENVNRYTKHMEGGERREFMQHRKDEKLILSVLKEHEERRKGCWWCNGIGATPENWECSLVGEFGTVTTTDNEVVWTTASFCPSCGRRLKENEDG